MRPAIFHISGIDCRPPPAYISARVYGARWPEDSRGKPAYAPSTARRFARLYRDHAVRGSIDPKSRRMSLEKPRRNGAAPNRQANLQVMMRAGASATGHVCTLYPPIVGEVT